MDYTASKGSTTVRNAPDVSMVADNISVFFNGSWTGFAGTSAAAPLWAGFMALANEQAAALGRPRVGFANPALWAIGRSQKGPTCFHDITIGNNFNSTNPNLYSAVAGYDLCTGWGTPNGQVLINALVGPGAKVVISDLNPYEDPPFVISLTPDEVADIATGGPYSANVYGLLPPLSIQWKGGKRIDTPTADTTTIDFNITGIRINHPKTFPISVQVTDQLGVSVSDQKIVRVIVAKDG